LYVVILLLGTWLPGKAGTAAISASAIVTLFRPDTCKILLAKANFTTDPHVQTKEPLRNC
jgi:hypothetical protein